MSPSRNMAEGQEWRGAGDTSKKEAVRCID